MDGRLNPSGRALLHAFFYLLYQPLAWSYDLVAWLVSLGRWQSWVRSVLPYVDGPRVLELCHGPGHLQAALHELDGVAAFGLDRSRQMGRLAQRRLKSSDQASRLLRGDATRLPFAPKSFDQVVATFPTEYILEPATLNGIQRLLRPRGRLVLLPVAWITGSSWPERAAAWLFRVTGQASDWNSHFSLPLRQAGFEVIEQPLDLDGSRVMLLLCHKLSE